MKVSASMQRQLNIKVKEKIAIEVIKVLITRFDNFPLDASNIRNAPFHEAFLNAFVDKLQGKVMDTPFFISLSSWLHGLNTTLGQVFFENVAHHISGGEKREYTSKRLGNLPINQSQRNYISKILADLSTSFKKPDLIKENSLIFKDFNNEVIDAMDFSADVFLQEEDRIIAVEIKSVKPNSGEMKGEKQKILEGKAALHKKFPGKKIFFYIGFPFDPTVIPEKESITGYDKQRFLKSIINMNKYFHVDETLVSREMWDYLSGKENTMEQILEIINKIATPQFIQNFYFIKSIENRDKKEYLKILEDWSLISEKELVLRNDELKSMVKNNKMLTRLYHKQPFDNKGNYLFDRYNELIKTLKS